MDEKSCGKSLAKIHEKSYNRHALKAMAISALGMKATAVQV